MWDDELESTRYKVFRFLFFGTLFSVVVTISTTLTTQYMEAFPFWFVEGLKVLYFITTPLASIITFFYAASLSHWKTSKQSLDKRWFLALVPYLCYIILILQNYVTHNVFLITREYGYQAGPLNRSTYAIAIVYMIGVIVVSLKNYRRTKQEINLILCLNILFACGISFFQLLFPRIILSGTASATGVLLVYLYVQNSMKSIDPLTDISNRRALMYQINKRAKSKSEFTLYLCSIRNFKSINECFSLETGDSVLEIVAMRLASVVPKKDIFRYSGDEFAILSYELPQNEDFLIQAVKSCFERPFRIEDYEIKVDAIYTRVDFPSFNKNIKTLLTTADYGIARLKTNTLDTDYLYDIHICDEMIRHNFVLEELKHAIAEDGFEILYQPIYSISNAKFRQGEALIRLRNGEKNKLYPNEFIPIAEKTGLIIQITYIVFKKVCKDLRQMQEELDSSICPKSISINFPYAMLLQDDLVENLLEIMGRYKIASKQIKLEITERTLVSDVKKVELVIHKMQRLGFEFELDDFGIEYSNMSVFLSLPINIIKIDRSLVLAVNESEKNCAFIKSLIKAIVATDRNVIIEGVEEESLVTYFKDCGCEYIQGYVFSKPLSYLGFTNFLRNN